MDLQQYLHAVRTYWWALAVPVVLGLGVGLLVTAQEEPLHRASVTFFVATSADADGPTAVQGDAFAQSRVNSYLELVSTDRLADKVIDASGVDLTAGQVTAMLDADATIDTVLLTATVTDESRPLVEQVAGAVATELVELVDEVENVDTGPPAARLEVVSGPSTSELPPRRALTVGLPTVVGLVVGLAVAWLLELRDNRIRSEAQLRDLHVGPVLGVIPVDRRLREPLLRHRPASTVGTESFRHLRTNLEFIDVNSPVQVLVVTSSVAQEGKTTACINLALTLVAAGKSVLLVEGDLRRPSLDDPLAVGPGVGLTDVVIGRADSVAALRPTSVRGLMVLPSGPLPPNPSELLGSDAMVDLLDRLRHRFDTVIVNTPPLLPVTDAAVLAAHADGVLVVVRAGKTTRQQLTQAMRSLGQVGARVVGTVLNMAAPPRGREYSAYWGTEDVPPERTPGQGPPGTPQPDTAPGRLHRAALHLPPDPGEAPGNGRHPPRPTTPPPGRPAPTAPTAPLRDEPRS